jgi:NADPH:quinone reductase-like Zn-dependent oxidoreductase
MMKAITSRRYGAVDEVLELVDVDELEMGDDEVLVQVDAASVNAADWHFVRGAPYIAGLQFRLGRPNFRIPSSDLAGTSEQRVGTSPGSSRARRSSAPPRCEASGTFAEFVSAPQTVVAPKPARLTSAEAAASPLAASRTLQALRHHRRVAPGDHVPIVGGSGGVGTFAAPIATAFDAEVTGVCSAHDLDLSPGLAAERSCAACSR